MTCSERPINFKFYPNLNPWHYGFSMYMEPLTKWAQHGPDSNFAIAIPLYFKPSFYEGLIFTTFYWKAVQGLKHVYVVKNTSSEIWFYTFKAFPGL